MHTVVETPQYIKALESIFSEAERTDREHGGNRPGDVMEGTGGFRKVRVGRGGMGKRGGARVIYILRNEEYPVFLMGVFAKSEKSNLTKKERNDLRARADEIFTQYRRLKR